MRSGVLLTLTFHDNGGGVGTWGGAWGWKLGTRTTHHDSSCTRREAVVPSVHDVTRASRPILFAKTLPVRLPWRRFGVASRGATDTVGTSELVSYPRGELRLVVGPCMAFVTSTPYTADVDTGGRRIVFGLGHVCTRRPRRRELVAQNVARRRHMYNVHPLCVRMCDGV